MKYLVFLFVTLYSYIGFGQEIIPANPKENVCYHSNKVNKHYVPPPASFRYGRSSRGSNPARIIVNYNGFTDEARRAFQRAVDIWASLLCSDVPINVNANFVDLGNGVLGQAGSGRIRNFKVGFDTITFYPTPIAEKIAGTNLNGDNPDISADFNSSTDWYYGLNGNPPDNQFDFVTIVLHELGHGLGFSTNADFYINGQGGTDSATLLPGGQTDIYARHMLDNRGLFLIDTNNYKHPSEELARIFIGDSIYFYNFLNRNETIRLYAPSPFSVGSSISHFDEDTYNDTEHALMTPVADFGEAVHSPGSFNLNMFADMGWVFLNITHQPITFLEQDESQVAIKAELKSDEEIVDTSVYIYYSSDNFMTRDSLLLSPNDLIYSNDLSIPQNLTYYISARDVLGRTFTLPSTLPESSTPHRYFSIIKDQDTVAPIIQHTEIEDIFILDSADLNIFTRVDDNFGIDTVFVEYFVGNDEGNIKSFGLTGDILRINFDASWPNEAFVPDSTVYYRIVTEDVSINKNRSFLPDNGFFSFKVVGLKPVQNNFINNFNDTLPAQSLFFGDFNVTTPEGFPDGGLHSDHPYSTANSLGFFDINFISNLLIPIVLDTIRPIMLFDEIALIELGESGTSFGDFNFYDFVIVEATNDFGKSWQFLLDGYDASDYQPWLDLYTENTDTPGTPSLYRRQIIDLTERTNFSHGDTLVFRFRLYSDPAARAWGWAIDNLDIQFLDISEKPNVNHIPLGFLLTETIDVPIKVTISHILPTITTVKWAIDGAEQTSFILDLNDVNSNIFPLGNDVQDGNIITYQLVTIDISNIPDTVTLPLSGNYIFPIMDRPQSVTSAFTTFDDNKTIPSSTYGFTIEQPANFSNNAIHSRHNYPDGTDLVYYLLQPIQINHQRSIVAFDEIVLVEPGTSTNINNIDFKDFVTLEYSDSDGKTWDRLKVYDSRDKANFLSAYGSSPNSTTSGSADLFEKRIIDIAPNQIIDQRNVFFRFRLSSDTSGNGWGWAIDNLSIQDPATSIQNAQQELNFRVNVYPNPAIENFTIALDSKTTMKELNISIYMLTGQKVFGKTLKNISKHKEKVSSDNLPTGIYIIRIHNNGVYQTVNLLVTH